LEDEQVVKAGVSKSGIGFLASIEKS